MKDSTEDIQKLIRLKRYERPPEGMVDDFLVDFHQRQRSELLRQSARGLFFERLGTFFEGFSVMKVAGAAGAACLAVAVAAPLLRQAPQPISGGSILPAGLDGSHGNYGTPVSHDPEDAKNAKGGHDFFWPALRGTSGDAEGYKPVLRGQIIEL